MPALFGLIAFASFVCILLGLVKPSLFNRLSKQPMTRIRALGIFSAIFIGSLILAAAFSPPTVQTENQAPMDAPDTTVESIDVTETETSYVEEDEAIETTFGNGVFIVGTDIQPGTYRTRTSSSGCYYARLSGFGGSLNEIISNANTNGPAVITIADTDKGFESTRCQMWTQDLSAITTSQTSFGDGIYIVGTDIQAGTYRSSGSDGCYYARLSSFSGSSSAILANNNTNTSAIVTIATTDKGFEATRCGTWTKLE